MYLDETETKRWNFYGRVSTQRDPVTSLAITIQFMFPRVVGWFMVYILINNSLSHPDLFQNTLQRTTDLTHLFGKKRTSRSKKPFDIIFGVVCLIAMAAEFSTYLWHKSWLSSVNPHLVFIFCGTHFFYRCQMSWPPVWLVKLACNRSPVWQTAGMAVYRCANKSGDQIFHLAFCFVFMAITLEKSNLVMSRLLEWQKLLEIRSERLMRAILTVFFGDKIEWDILDDA